MASPAPKTNFYVNYGAVQTAVNTDALSPVFIAPRYAIHSSAYANAELVDSDSVSINYSGAAISGLQWPAYSGGIVDTAGAQLIATNAAVILGSGNTAAGIPVTVGSSTLGGANTLIDFGSGGIIQGANTILTLGYQLQAGDRLQISSGGSSVTTTVVAVEQSTSAATCQVTSSIATSGAAVFSGDMTRFSGQTDAVYLLTVTEVTSSGLTANIVGVAGDTGYSDTGVVFAPAGDAVEIGNYHLDLTLSSLGDAAAANQSYQIYCATQGVGAYTRAVVATPVNLVAGTAQIITGNLVTSPTPVAESGWSCNSSVINILAEASVVFTDVSLKLAQCGPLYVNYRELISEGANQLISGNTATLTAFAGPAVPENPLGMLLAAGAKSGVVDFYLMSVSADTDEAYETALTAAAKVESVYALFPLRQTDAVIAKAQELVAYYSGAAVAQVKRLWLYSQVQQLTPILESTVNTPVLAKVSGNVLTLSSGSFDGVALTRGSQVVFTNVYVAGQGLVPTLTLTITAKTSDTTATIAEAGISITAPSYATFYNVLTPSEYAAAIAAKARSYDNHRINFIFSEANTVAGAPAADARYITAVLMAMRAATAPHAPLTDLVIPGTSIAESVGFSTTDYETMNNAGVWVCYRNNRDEVVSRHAVTTGKAGTIAEEDSAVSNGDNILRFVRNSIAFLNGSCNVTPALIATISVNVYNAFDRIIGRVYPDLIGSQILSVDGVSIIQDPNNSAGVIGIFDLDLPSPYLEGNFTFNLF